MLASILERHAAELPFLFQLRELAALAPQHDKDSLAGVDERIDAHLDGLRIAGEKGVEIAQSSLDPSEPGSVFAFGVLALERASEPALGKALELAAAAPPLGRALVAALAWVSYELARPAIAKLIDGNAPSAHLRIGIAASAAHRRDPGPPLAWAIHHDDLSLRARALRAAGELARHDLAAEVREETRSADETCRFWSAWSSVLLGDNKATDVLWAFAHDGGPFAERAVGVAARRGDPRDVRPRIEGLGAVAETARTAVLGAEASGDPALIPWLIERTSSPALARLAGEAFGTITSAVIERDLAAPPPPEHTPAPIESPRDPVVAMDPDRALVWPNTGGLQRYWAAREKGYRKGSRYLLGAQINADQAERVLNSSSQRRRAQAAIELALQRPGRPLVEVRARS